VPLNVCTAVAANYLAHARVLARSVRRHHPGARVWALVVDPDPPLGDDEPFEALLPGDAGVADDELARRALIYPTQALVSAHKPVLVRECLRRAGGEPVLFLDADVLVCGDLTGVAEQAASDTLLLSPHSSLPLPHVPGGPSPEEVFLRAGVFNGGFLGAAPGAEPFLDWWAERCARDSVQDSERGILLSQSWLQLAPALSPSGVLRDPGCNVMTHNLLHRDVSWTPSGALEIAGAPLRFYHFGGFDPYRPEELTKHAVVASWQRMEEHPGVARLAGEYVEALRAAGLDDVWGRIVYGGALPGGTAIGPVMRRAYREALLAAERSGTALPPNPLADGDEAGFLAWLRSAEPGSRVSRYLLALLAQRADLRIAFPDVPGGSEAAFLAWAERHLAAEDESWALVRG
jgi:hypothetical protein